MLLSSFLFRKSTPSSSSVRSLCAVISMSTSSSFSPLSHQLTLPTQRSQPVQIVAAPHLTPTHFRNAIESSLFKNWLANMQSQNGILANRSMLLEQVLIQDVDMFSKGIGFLKFKADVRDTETGQKVPGIVFARGASVAVLVLLDSEDETYAVLTEQARVPTGKVLLELPAGMLDDDKGDFVGTAVREVEEEVGIHLNKDNMVDLTSFLDPSTGYKVFPSPVFPTLKLVEQLARLPRLNNLFIFKNFLSRVDVMKRCVFFLYRVAVDQEVISELQDREMGLREYGELIKVHVVPYRKLWRITADAKVLMAVALYEMAIKDDLLP